MAVDPFSELLGAIVGRAIGAAGVRGGVSLGHSLGRAFSRATGADGGNSQGGSGSGSSGGAIPDEVKSLLNQPLHLLMPNLPKVAYQPLLQGGMYHASNERGEAVGEGFKNVLDAISKMDEMITAHRARFISEKTGVPLMVNAAGEIVRGAAGGDGASASGGISNLAGLVAMLVRGGAGGGAAGAGAGAAGGAAGAAGGAAGAGAAAGLLATPAAVAIGIGALGVAVAAAPFAIRSWTESLLQSNEGLRRFNGQMNVTFAEFERRDLLRAKGQADATSGSTSVLAEAVSDLKDDIQPITNAASTFINLVGAGLARMVELQVIVLENMPVIKEGIWLLGKIEEHLKKQEQLPALKWFDDIADGKFSGYDRTRRTRQQQPGGRP